MSGQKRKPRAWRRRLSFTRDGRIFCFVTVGVGFAAVNTGNNLLYLLLAWSLSFIVASGVLSERNLKGLTVQRRPPPHVHAGQPFLMEVVIKNDKPKRASYSIEIEDLLGGRPLDKKCYFLKIPSGKTQRTSYRHTFARRGLYTLEGFRVATKFPFALFRKSKDVVRRDEVLVYPALVAVPRPAPRPAHDGDVTSGKLGRRGDFYGLREYKDGDDRRDVDWKASAKAARTMVREYEDEQTRRAAIVLDNAVSPDTLAAQKADALDAAAQAQLDALERAVSRAASLAVAYLEAGWSVQVAARGGDVPLGFGRPQVARVLRMLALIPATTRDVPLPRVDPRITTIQVSAA